MQVESVFKSITMNREKSYIKFVRIACLVISTLLFLAIHNEEDHVVSSMNEDIMDADAKIDRLKLVYSNIETTSVRMIKTKTRYPDGMHVPFLLNNRNMCRKYEKISVLVMVHTAIRNFWRRKEMRRTWLNSSHYSPENLQVIFLVGTTSIKQRQNC